MYTHRQSWKTICSNASWSTSNLKANWFKRTSRGGNDDTAFCCCCCKSFSLFLYISLLLETLTRNDDLKRTVAVTIVHRAHDVLLINFPCTPHIRTRRTPLTRNTIKYLNERERNVKRRQCGRSLQVLKVSFYRVIATHPCDLWNEISFLFRFCSLQFNSLNRAMKCNFTRHFKWIRNKEKCQWDSNENGFDQLILKRLQKKPYLLWVCVCVSVAMKWIRFMLDIELTFSPNYYCTIHTFSASGIYYVLVQFDKTTLLPSQCNINSSYLSLYHVTCLVH